MEEEGIVLTIPDFMNTEMSQIKKNLGQYPNYKKVSAALLKFIPKKITAAIIGCIIPESGSDHTILNKKEFNGGGTNNDRCLTSGWHCGEGLIQWTYFSWKIDKIKAYNKDSRSTQKLPETWAEYSSASQPYTDSYGLLHALQDGKHIAGLTFENQMLFLTKYYSGIISSQANEKNLAVITAKVYQQKAGTGFFKEIKDPVIRAYATSKEKYPSKSGNHFLQSLKLAQEFCNCPIETIDVEYDLSLFGSSSYSGGGGGISWGGAGGSGLRDSRLSAKKPLKMKKGVLLGSHLNPK